MTTTKENVILNDVLNSVKNLKQELKDEVDTFKKNTIEYLRKIEEKVNIQYVPIQLEKDFTKIMQQSLNEMFVNLLKNPYNSPLLNIMQIVINNNKDEIMKIFNESLLFTINTEQFKQSLNDAFYHHIGRNLIANSSSIVQKSINGFNDSPEFKAKLTIAIAEFVKEYNNSTLIDSNI